MKIRKSQINSFLGLIVVLFSILLSKTVYFGIINRTTYQYIYYGIVIAMAVFCGLEIKKLKMGIIISFPLIFLMIININAIECIVLVMTFLVLHMTEGLWCLPIYLIIPLMGIISRGGVPLSRLIHWLKEDKLVYLPLALVQGANV